MLYVVFSHPCPDPYLPSEENGETLVVGPIDFMRFDMTVAVIEHYSSGVFIDIIDGVFKVGPRYFQTACVQTLEDPEESIMSVEHLAVFLQIP